MTKVIAVDLGGTNLRVALVKGKKVLRYDKRLTPKTKDELLELMVKMISEVISKEVKGIGVGSPGPLKDGVILNTPNLPLKYFDLQGFLTRKFKVKVRVENDAKCVALAESKYGCKKKNFFILTFGTGIGGGIIIDGNLYKGKGNAGELGHIILNRGKDFEYWWKYYKKGKIIKELVDSKKPEDKKTLGNLTDCITEGIASLIDVFDPEIVVLMGGARESGNKFLKIIQKKIDNYKILKGKYKIVWSKLKHPGILGAATLVQ